MLPKYNSKIGLPVAIFFIFIIGCLDYYSGFKFGIFPLYLIPIAIIAWNESVTTAILCSMLAAAIMIVKDVYGTFAINADFYFFGGVFVKALIMFLNGYIFWKIKSLIVEKDRLNIELQKSLAEIRELREMIPICAWCHSVRNDKGFYEKIETYLSKVTGSQLTHGICPACMEKYYGNLNRQSEDKSE